MVKKLLLFSTLLLITIIPNIDVNAITFSKNGIGCVYFWDGHQYCDSIQDFSYDNINYYGANFSYTPDNNPTISATIVEYNNQSFCANNSSGGVLNVRFYHNYPFENSVFNFIQIGVDNVNTTCTTSLSPDGRYSDVSCPISHGFSNKTVGFKYRFNDLGFGFPFTSGFSNIVTSENCGISGGDIITNQNQNTQDIINNNNSNTQNIINNNTNNTNQIIQNNEQNTQDIIDNQNSNTDKEINSQLICKEANTYTFIDGKNLSNSGTLLDNSNTKTTDFIEIPYSITPIDSLYTSSTSRRICFYSSNSISSVISCLDNYSLTLNTPIVIPSNAKYFRFTLNKFVGNANYDICYNGNQALNDSVNDLNDNITSEDTPNTNQDIEDMQDMIASDTPITDLLTLPMTLINAYYTGISSSCSPYNFGSLLGTDIIFPCIDLQQRLGSNLWLIIDSLCSIFLIYSIAMLFVHAFDSLTSLKDDFDDMYVPRHAGKHVGSGING